MRLAAPLRPRHVLLALLVLLAVAASCGTASAAVVVSPWGPATVDSFPPDEPPDDMDEEDEADAQPWVLCRPDTVIGHWNGADSTFTVDSLGDVRVSGHTGLRLPTDVDSALAEHEHGHDRLNRWEYERRAKKKVEDAIRGFVGTKFKGVGATDAERRADAARKAAARRDSLMAQAEDAITKQMDVLGGAYDDLTDHGRSETCDTDQGEQKVKADHMLAPAAGMFPKELDPGRSWCRATGEAGYDPVARAIRIGPLVVVETQVPGEPLTSCLCVCPEPLLVVGQQENGTLHLADTRLRVVHGVTGDDLLSGYLLEPAFMPSNIAGYPGMIQAHLELLPAWAGGFFNPIGSPFLSGMEAADLADEQSTAWIAFPVPAGDPGLWDAPWMAPVTMTLGVAPAGPIGVGPGAGALPGRLLASPSPARGALRFSWRPTAAPLKLEVYDVAGARRWSGHLDGARGEWAWSARDAGGSRLPAGVYFVRLAGGGTDLRARVVLLP